MCARLCKPVVRITPRMASLTNRPPRTKRPRGRARKRAPASAGPRSGTCVRAPIMRVPSHPTRSGSAGFNSNTGLARELSCERVVKSNF